MRDMSAQMSAQVPGIHQDDRSFETIAGRGALPKSSWLYHALKGLPLQIYVEELRRWDYIPHSFTFPDGQGLLTVDAASIDLGNRNTKLCVQSHTGHRLVTLEIPAMVRLESGDLRHGTISHDVWRVTSNRQPVALVHGEDALEGGRGFIVGGTADRFLDDLYIDFLRISLVRALRRAGYRPGTHRLALGVGIRLDEVTITQQEGQRTDPRVAEAIRRLKEPFTVEWTSPHGEVESMTIQTPRMWPIVQTLGTFFSYFYTLVCEPSQDHFNQIGVLDWGTEDLGWGTARYQKGRALEIRANPVAKGLVQVATALQRAVNTQFKSVPFALTDALQSLVSGYITIGGRNWNLGAEGDHPRQLTLNTALQEGIQSLLRDANPYFKRGDLLLINAGGGLKAPRMAQEIQTRLQTLERPQEDYLLVPEEVTTVSNAIGLYVYVYMQLLLRRRELGNGHIVVQPQG